MTQRIEDQSAVQANAGADNDIGGTRFRWPGVVLVACAGLLVGIVVLAGWQYMRFMKGQRQMEREQREMVQASPAVARPTQERPAVPDRGLAGRARDAILGERTGENPLPSPRAAVVHSGRQQRPETFEEQRRRVEERAKAGAEVKAEPKSFVGMPVRQAEVYAGNAAYFISAGRKLACETTEPIRGISGHNFTARLTDDVRGDSYTEIAIPRDSMVFGKIIAEPDDETGDMRFAAILEHIRWPNPPGKPIIGISLGSDLAEPIGDIGSKGNTKTHFWTRLGASMAFAAVDAVSNIGGSMIDGMLSGGGEGGGQNVNVNVGSSLRRGTGGIAREEYQRQGKRKPTFDRPPGQPCSVFVKVPLDTTKAATAWRSAR